MEPETPSSASYVYVVQRKDIKDEKKRHKKRKRHHRSRSRSSSSGSSSDGSGVSDGEQMDKRAQEGTAGPMKLSEYLYG